MSAADLTLAEIQALPVGTVVVDGDGDQHVREAVPEPSRPAAVWRWYDAGDEDCLVTAEQMLEYPPAKLVSTP